MGAIIIRNSRILDAYAEHGQDEQVASPLAREGKEGLGMNQQLEAVRAPSSVGSGEVQCHSRKEADVG